MTIDRLPARSAASQTYSASHSDESKAVCSSLNGSPGLWI